MALADASWEVDGSVLAYVMYLEVAEGNLRGEWKLYEPMGFWRFREKLSNRMLK